MEYFWYIIAAAETWTKLDSHNGNDTVTVPVTVTAVLRLPSLI